MVNVVLQYSALWNFEVQCISRLPGPIAKSARARVIIPDKLFQVNQMFESASRGWYVEQKLGHSCSFRCDQIHNNQCCESEAVFLVMCNPSMNEL
jgi:hypothetical protein